MSAIHAAAPTGTERSAVSTIALSLSMLALVLMGAISGFFYAYSCSVMIGLNAVEPEIAIAAMQGVNATVRNAYFAPSFFGAPLACLAAALALYSSGARRAALIMAGAGLVYLAGGLALTMAINVPMNEALALHTIPQDRSAAAALWRDYAEPWTYWNHVRAAVSFISLILVGAALYAASKRTA